jgi:hypothetical protein
MLETFENQLRVIAKDVIWLLEESFPGSRALAERYCRGYSLILR